MNADGEGSGRDVPIVYVKSGGGKREGSGREPVTASSEIKLLARAASGQSPLIQRRGRIDEKG
jgi:hypothetical protein